MRHTIRRIESVKVGFGISLTLKGFIKMVASLVYCELVGGWGGEGGPGVGAFR